MTAAALSRLRPWWPAEASYALRLGISSIVAIYLAMRFELDTPEWAGWTVLSVSLATRASSLQKSLWRAVGSVCGAVVSLALVANFAQSTLAFDVALALWLALAAAAATVERGQRSYGFALLGFTVPIVTLGNVDRPDLIFHTALDRCSTLLLGIACAHASSVLVASGVRQVGGNLADALHDATSSCADWLGRRDDGARRDPPWAAVLALDAAVADAFTEQSSLQTGGHAVCRAPLQLLRMLAVGLLRLRLAPWQGSDPERLLGGGFGRIEAQLRRARLAGALLRSGRRIGNRHGRAHPLAIDRDGRQALDNAVRTAVAVSLADGFWYVSGWPTGSDAVTWAAMVSLLFAARPDAATAARNFLIGAAIAAPVGIVVRYLVLTVGGDFPLLAAVLLPVCMLAALARADRRAAFGAGYAMVVLNVIAPENVMRFQLDATLNRVLADLIGMGVAVVAFTSLPPPASPATRRLHAKRRMANDLRAVACRPSCLLPVGERWLARMSDRLAQLGPEGPAATGGGEALLLLGLLLLALRRSDDRLGREIGRLLWSGGPGTGAEIERLAARRGGTPLQRDQVAALSRLLGADGLQGWPGVRWPGRVGMIAA